MAQNLIESYHMSAGSPSINQVNTTTTAIWLKIERVGTSIKTYYSGDGETWAELSPATLLANSGAVKVGVFCNDPGGSELLKAKFDGFWITPQAVYWESYFVGED